MQISRFHRDLILLSLGRKGVGHRGLEIRKGGSLRENLGCAARERQTLGEV